jgi:RNA polymerase sigma factor (sigma-70 family)
MNAVPIRPDCGHVVSGRCPPCLLLSICREIADEMRSCLSGDIIDGAIDLTLDVALGIAGEALFGDSEQNPQHQDTWEENLRKVAWKTARSLQRKRRPWAQDPASMADIYAYDADDSTMDRREEMALAIDDELDCLSPTQRTIFQFHFIEHITFREMANILRRSPGTISTHVAEIRRRLCKRLAWLVQK